MGSTGIQKTAKTPASGHGDRKRAPKGSSAALLLDELDAVVGSRDKSGGRIGNLRGALSTAEANLEREVINFNRLEDKAARLRQAFTVLTTGADGEALTDVNERLISGVIDDAVWDENMQASVRHLADKEHDELAEVVSH